MGIFIFLLNFMLFFCNFCTAEESISLSTYYPAPYGDYENITTNTIEILNVISNIEKDSFPVVYKPVYINKGGLRVLGDLCSPYDTTEAESVENYIEINSEDNKLDFVNVIPDKNAIIDSGTKVLQLQTPAIKVNNDVTLFTDSVKIRITGNEVFIENVDSARDVNVKISGDLEVTGNISSTGNLDVTGTISGSFGDIKSNIIETKAFKINNDDGNNLLSFIDANHVQFCSMQNNTFRFYNSGIEFCRIQKTGSGKGVTSTGRYQRVASI